MSDSNSDKNDGPFDYLQLDSEKASLRAKQAVEKILKIERIQGLYDNLHLDIQNPNDPPEVYIEVLTTQEMIAKIFQYEKQVERSIQGAQEELFDGYVYGILDELNKYLVSGMTVMIPTDLTAALETKNYISLLAKIKPEHEDTVINLINMAERIYNIHKLESPQDRHFRYMKIFRRSPRKPRLTYRNTY